MPKLLITFLIAVLLGLAAHAQNDESATAADKAPEQGRDQDSAEANAEEVDDTDLDEQTYEDDEDDFIPTEEIPTDEPIPFPTNI